MKMNKLKKIQLEFKKFKKDNNFAFL